MGMAPGPRFGVEEEFLVVDPDTGAAVPQAAAAAAADRPRRQLALLG
jgi:hypothetical protein